MTKIEAIKAELLETVDTYLKEDRIHEAKVTVEREPIRDLEAEAAAQKLDPNDEAYRWKRGKNLVVKLTVELKDE